MTQNEWLNPMKYERLHQLPSAGPALHAHHSRDVPYPGQVRQFPEAVVSPHPVGARRRTHVRTARQGSRCRTFTYFADWTDRIAKGELPHAKPPRPQGVERNIVVTTWDWLDDNITFTI